MDSNFDLDEDGTIIIVELQIFNNKTSDLQQLINQSAQHTSPATNSWQTIRVYWSQLDQSINYSRRCNKHKKCDYSTATQPESFPTKTKTLQQKR